MTIYKRPTGVVGERESSRPIPDNYPDDNIPYRGPATTHGVIGFEPAPLDAEELDYGDPEVDFIPVETPAIGPIPVRIVNEDDAEIKSAFVGVFTLTGTSPVLILGEDRSRTNAKMMCLLKNVFIGPDNTVSPTNGFPIVFGASALDYNTTEPVYACCATGDTGTLYVWVERSYEGNPDG